MVMDYIQRFQTCHGTIENIEEFGSVFIRASSVDVADPYSEGFVRIHVRNRHYDVKAEIEEVVEWMNFYAPSTDA